MILPLTLLSVI